MTIQARFASTCPDCGGRIAPGQEVNWSKGQKATHVACPSKAKIVADSKQILSSVPPRSSERTNRKADHCMNCGEWVAAGAGILVFCMEDGGCRQHFDQSGYHVACKDEAGCQKRRVEAQAAAKVRKAEKAAKDAADKLAAEAAKAEYQAALTAATAGMVKVSYRPEGMAQPGQQVAGYSNGANYDGFSVGADGILTRSYGGYDDYRCDYWVPASHPDADTDAAMAKQWAAILAEKSPRPEGSILCVLQGAKYCGPDHVFTWARAHHTDAELIALLDGRPLRFVPRVNSSEKDCEFAVSLGLDAEMLAKDGIDSRGEKWVAGYGTLAVRT